MVNRPIVTNNNLSNDSWAVVRALNRYGLHCDAKHSLTLGGKDGLHRDHVALTVKTGDLKEDELKRAFDEHKRMLCDIFDAATALDRADGGFTMVLRVPGTLPFKEYSIRDMCVDTYLPPRELHEAKPSLKHAISKIVGIFAEDIAFPHLNAVQARHTAVGIPPLLYGYQGPRTTRPANPHLPAPVEIPSPSRTGSAWYQFKNGFLSRALQGLEEERLWNAESAHLVEEVDKVTAIPARADDRNVYAGGDKTGADTSSMVNRRDREHSTLGTHKNKVGTLSTSRGSASTGTTHQPSSPVSIPSAPAARTVALPTPPASDASVHDGAGSSTPTFPTMILSIGPHTDAIIDALSLDDTVIPLLRNILLCYRRNRWEKQIMASGFDEDVAQRLASALENDLKESSCPKVISH